MASIPSNGLPVEPRPNAGSDRGPLAGVRVVDLTQILAGPYCTRLLADLGAEVIKIERPPAGDPSRTLPLALTPVRSGYFLWLNAGKRSLCLDMGREGGRQVVRDLVRRSDVLVENMRPGTLAAKDLGYDALRRVNPRLVMCSISAFGQTGPLGDRAGQGIIAEAMGGVLDMTGTPDGPPTPPGVSIADVAAGMYAFGAIAAALFRRERTGRGEYVDVSLLEAVLPFHETAFEEYLLSHGEVRPTRFGLEHRSVVPYGVYRAPDGYVVIAAGTDALWRRLTAAIGRPDLAEAPDYATNDARLGRRGEVRALLERWLAAQGGRARALAALEAAGVPCGPVCRIEEIPEHPQLRARRAFVDVRDPVVGDVRTLNTPFRLGSGTAGVRGPAPLLGAHTLSILRNVLGYPEERCRALLAEGTVYERLERIG